MIFGLRFTSETGEFAELAVNTDKQQLLFRSTKGGAWQSWKRADVDRRADGTLDEAVYEAVKAKSATTASKFTTPVTVNFSGAVVGSMSFDGSQSPVSCSLTMSNSLRTAIQSMINAAIAAHVGSSSGGYDSSDSGEGV